MSMEEVDGFSAPRRGESQLSPAQRSEGGRSGSAAASKKGSSGQRLSLNRKKSALMGADGRKLPAGGPETSGREAAGGRQIYRWVEPDRSKYYLNLVDYGMRPPKVQPILKESSLLTFKENDDQGLLNQQNMAKKVYEQFKTFKEEQDQILAIKENLFRRMTEKHIVHKKISQPFGSSANPRRSAITRDARQTLDVRTEEPRLVENNTESNISTKRDDLD